MAAVTATAGVAFNLPGAAGEAKLTNCNGRWQWTSTALGQSIDEGTQLAVGMPFTRYLAWVSSFGPGTPDTFGTVDVFAKYLVGVASRFDNIYLSLCDNAGNSVKTSDLQPSTSDSTWYTVGLRKNSSWDDWDVDNLRVVLTFQGTSDYRNVGLTTVEIEWFAVGLK